MGQPSYGPTIRQRAKRLVEALLAYVNYEIEDWYPSELKWRWKDGDSHELIVETTVEVLKELTRKYDPQNTLKENHIKEAFQRLADLSLLEDNRSSTQGSKFWHFTLSLWSRDKSEILQQFDGEWERRKPRKSDGDDLIGSPSQAVEEKALSYNDLGMDSYQDDSRFERLRESLSFFKEAIKHYPNLPEAHYNLGCIYEEILEFEDALCEYREAVISGFPPAYNNMARLLIKQGKNYAEAARLLQQGLKLTADSESEMRYALWKNLGWARLKQSLYPEAKSALQEAIALNERRAAAHCLLAQVLEAEENRADALVEWERCSYHARGEDADTDVDEWVAIARQRLTDEVKSS